MSNFFIIFLRLMFFGPDGDGIASRYGDRGDIWAMQALACAPTKHIDQHIHVCAHRYLPCGTKLILENARTGETSWCTVMDRGPYGAMINVDGQATWGLKIKPSDPGRWRGILDLSPAVSNELRHNGFERVRYWVYNPLQMFKYMVHFYKRKVV